MNSVLPSARLRPFRPVAFGRYTLLSPLAMGGMGEIFLARFEGAQGFDKLCVIKKILPAFAQDAAFVERFVNEARILEKLSHGSIAQVLDMGLHEGEPYIAIEFVDGKDLRKVIARAKDRGTRLPLAFSLHVMSRVLDALAYAHRKRDDDDRELNLVHRDVSPPNVLISYEGEVKVIDFGLAKSSLSDARTHPSMILGKFRYMSPEQARHLPVDRRADLYAVGLCLYELLAGTNPFEDVSPHDLIQRVANPEFPPLEAIAPDCPPQVRELVSRALELDPDRRFQSAEEFRGRLAAVLMELDSSAGPESVSETMRDAFGAEYQQERRLLTSLRTVKVNATVQVEPLSFAPSPRIEPASGPNEDGETSPSIQLAETELIELAEHLDDEDTHPPLHLGGAATSEAVPAVRRNWILGAAIGVVLAGVAAGAFLFIRKVQAPSEAPPLQAPFAPPPAPPQVALPAPPAEPPLIEEVTLPDEALLAPLIGEQPAARPPRPAARNVRPASVDVSPELKALRDEWSRAQVPFRRLRKQHGCTAPKMRLVCAQARMITTDLKDVQANDSEHIAQLRGYIDGFREDVDRLSAKGSRR